MRFRVLEQPVRNPYLFSVQAYQKDSKFYADIDAAAHFESFSKTNIEDLSTGIREAYVRHVKELGQLCEMENPLSGLILLLKSKRGPTIHFRKENPSEGITKIRDDHESALMKFLEDY